MLLHEAVVEHDAPHLGVAQVRRVRMHPSERRQILVAALIRVVEVVPHRHVVGVDATHGIDVAGFDGGEHAVGERGDIGVVHDAEP